MLSPDFAGLDQVEATVGATKSPDATEATPPPPVRPPVPLHLPVGRILSVLICVAYIIGAFTGRHFGY